MTLFDRYLADCRTRGYDPIEQAKRSIAYETQHVRDSRYAEDIVVERRDGWDYSEAPRS